MASPGKGVIKVELVSDYRYWKELAADVPVLLRWERYVGGTHGFANMPAKAFSFSSAMSHRGWMTGRPGLSDFHMAGAWATSTGALFANALSGRRVIEQICRKEGKRFITG